MATATGTITINVQAEMPLRMTLADIYNTKHVWNADTESVEQRCKEYYNEQLKLRVDNIHSKNVLLKPRGIKC
jgi:hypothetical protein